MKSLPSLFRKFIADSHSLEVFNGVATNLFRKDMHYKCRNNKYPRSDIERFFVPDDKVSWKEKYDGYNPPTYTSPGVLNQPWADPDIGTVGFSPQWNTDNGEINRLCGSHKYEIDNEGYPINPVGRTGLKGRGILGRWGSNCAGDCIVTRWKRDDKTHQVILDSQTNKGILEFIATRRKDCGEWAIPGGFADRSENVMNTIKREFFEEALGSNVCFMDVQNEESCNNLEENKNPKDFALKILDKLFENGKVVYSGYVDDIRNTDQAWISTTALNVHDENGTLFNAMKLQAGDDADDVRWMEVNNAMQLYASHKSFLQATTELLGANF